MSLPAEGYGIKEGVQHSLRALTHISWTRLYTIRPMPASLSRGFMSIDWVGTMFCLTTLSGSSSAIDTSLPLVDHSPLALEPYDDRL